MSDLQAISPVPVVSCLSDLNDGMVSLQRGSAALDTDKCCI